MRNLALTPFSAVRARLTTMGFSDVTESLWNVARANIMSLTEVGQWLQVVKGPVTPVVQDAAFLSDATELLPASPWTDNSWSDWTNALKAKTGRKGKDLFMPLRLALTSHPHGPEMKYLLPMIGEKRVRDLLAGKAA